MLKDKIKLALRRTGNAFDSQIDDCIEYVRQDVLDIGIFSFDEDNPRVQNLAILYSKATFNFENKGEWYMREYERLRNQMSLQGDYT